MSGALSPLSRDTVSGSKRSHSPTARTKDPINWRETGQTEKQWDTLHEKYRGKKQTNAKQSYPVQTHCTVCVCPGFNCNQTLINTNCIPVMILSTQSSWRFNNKSLKTSKSVPNIWSWSMFFLSQFYPGFRSDIIYCWSFSALITRAVFLSSNTQQSKCMFFRSSEGLFVGSLSLNVIFHITTATGAAEFPLWPSTLCT